VIIASRAILASSIVIAGVSAVGWTQSPGPTITPVAVTDVTVIDVERGERLVGRTVLFRNGRIEAIGPTGGTQPPDGVEVVAGHGRFLIPGLWDMHVHLGGYDSARRNLSLLLANGVTGVRDMASPLDDVMRLRQEVRDGTVIGPRLMVAGPLLQGPLPPQLRMPLLISIETTAQAASTVEMLQQRGVDFIKVQDAVPRDIYFAIADTAQRHRLPLAGHIPPTVTASEASDAGQKSIEHLGGRFHGVYVGASRDEEQLVRDSTRMYGEALQAIERNQEPSPSSLQAPYVKRLLETYDEDKATALWRRFVLNGTWQCPTLVTRRGLWAQERQRLTEEDQRAGADMIRRDLQLVAAMRRAGVRLLAGTDLPLADGQSHLPDELALLVEAGLTPLEALQSATRDAAAFLGRGDQLGSIAPGKNADAVLLEGDPLLDVVNVKRIAAVITAGRLLSRSDLERLKAATRR